MLLLQGQPGALGGCIAECAVKSRSIDKVLCMYRNAHKLGLWSYADHPKVVPVWHDGRRPQEDTQLLQELEQAKPGSIAFIHTAFCIQPIKRTGTYLADEVCENISVNVLDMVLLANRLLEFAEDRNVPLRIIQIDSGAACRPPEGWGLYAAAKAYANVFLRSIQLEHPAVKVVSYEPGVVDTPMQEEIRRTDPGVCGQVGQFLAYYQTGMLRSPEAVAGDLFARFVEGWDGKQLREGYPK